MGIGSWFKKWRQQGDAEAIERQEEWATETPEERRVSQEGVVGVQADDSQRAPCARATSRTPSTSPKATTALSP